MPVAQLVGSFVPVGSSSSLDWRDYDAVTSIKNQGSCGSCWTFAAAAYAESKLIIQGKYNKNNIDLSEQYLLECTPSSDCGGGFLEYAMESVRECPTDDRYPYHPYKSFSGICNAGGIYVGEQTVDYYNLADDDLISLLQEGPVAISVASGGWETYSSGVFSCSLSAGVDHAVLLIGYTPSAWIVKNQWGPTWGDNGYMYISRGANDCQIGTSAHIMMW